MRIASLTSADLINGVYRSIMPCTALAERGHRVLVEDSARPPREALFDFELVHIFRATTAPVLKMARRLHDAGVAIVWDNDDDLSEIPTKARRGGLEAQRNVSGLTAMLAIADVVTSPSTVLAAHHRARGARRVEVLENYLFDGSPRPPTRAQTGRVVLGWTAGDEHVVDLEGLDLRHTFKDLLARHPHLHIESLGMDLRLPPDRYTHHRYVPHPDLVAHIARWDIGIAPLSDIPFNRNRSNIKVKEYAAAGIPWLASATGPYLGMGDRQGGRLVADDAWGQELDRLISSARDRQKLAKKAARWAQSQTISRNIRGWERVFEEALRAARARTA